MLSSRPPIDLLPHPPRDLTLGSPDGAYYAIVGSLAQIGIVGPMLYTPREYLDAFHDLVQQKDPKREFEIVDVDVMKGPVDGSDDLRRNVLHRGFFTISLAEKTSAA